MNYYNEFEKDAAQWLRNLIEAGLIPHGDVDTRSIEDVKPNELDGYTQCHFFAGIGGWPLALYWMAHADQRTSRQGSANAGRRDSRGNAEQRGVSGGSGESGGLANSIEGQRGRRPVDGPLQQHGQARGRQQVAGDAQRGGESGRLGIANNAGPQPGQPAATPAGHRGSAESAGTDDRGAGDGIKSGLEGHTWHGNHGNEPGRDAAHSAGSITTSSDACIWIPCADGVSRPASAEPGAFPLAYGLPRELGRGKSELAGLVRGRGKNRVVRLRGYGNAIDPRVAAQFLMAVSEIVKP